MASKPVWRAFFPQNLSQLLGPLLLAGAFTLLGTALLVGSGIVNLAASEPHPQGWADFLHTTFDRSIAHHAADIKPPADLDSIPINRGALQFDMVCASCHSTPGRGQSLVALSMRPQPQYLPGVAATLSPSELFWIIKHGVKYTAMPAWPTQLRDDEIWAMVAFARKLPQMTPEQYAALTHGAALPPAPPPGTPVTARNVDHTTLTKPPADPEASGAYPATGFALQRVVPPSITGCTACHGTDGNAPASGGIPLLGVLAPDFIRSALADFAHGHRPSGFMQPIAAQLTHQQIEGLATHFGSPGNLPRQGSGTPHPTDPALLARGRQIALTGINGQGACQECHDVNRATRKFYLRLDGQDWRYMRNQMQLFRDGVRRDTVAVDPMPKTAHRLTNADIDAVAAWYAARSPQPPLPVAEATPSQR